MSALVVWVIGIATGFAAFMNYDATSGIPANPSRSWPAGTSLTRVPGQLSIVMLAHPRCPCTRASLTALRELSQYCRSRATIDVVFWMPQDAGADWIETPLWKQAETIPGARLHRDFSGTETRLFDTATSGQVLVYDADGVCVFRGGITPARGQFGDSDGASAIRNLIEHQSRTITDTPVFGCDLWRRQATCGAERAL